MNARDEKAGRIRVLFLINDLQRAGAETQLVELALALDPAVYEVEIALVKRQNHFADRLARAGIPVHALDRRGPWDVSFFFRLLHLLRSRAPQILHSYLFFSNVAAAVAGRWARVPVIVLSQRCSYEAQLTPLWRFVARGSHGLADCVIVNSEAARAEEIAAGFSPDSIVTVPNGIAIAEIDDVRREDLGLPAGPLVMSLGQLEEVKGHRVLLAAWPRVLEAVPDAHLAVVGDGPRRAALTAFAERLGISGRVLFLGFREPAGPLLRAADLLAHPSLSEGMPNAVLEAMAAARPVVATRAGGTPELVVEGETGLLVPPGDPAALAKALVQALRDEPWRRAAGTAGHQRAVEHFSLRATREATERVYRAALGVHQVP